MLALITFLLIRSVLSKKKSLPVRLFIEAQKNENDGQFEAALIAYGSALHEASKVRFHGSLKNKITDKLKVLQTIIEYKNNLQFVRQYP